MKVEKERVKIDVGEIFTCTWTPEELKKEHPIILLHDSLGCVGLWKDFPEKLARQMQQPVVAYDRLGAGKSSPLKDIPSVDFIEKEAFHFFPQLISALGIDKFSLLGHSVGGAMALLIASNNNSSCQSVITVAAQAYVEEKTITSIAAAEQFFKNEEHFNKLVKWHGNKAKWVLDAWTIIWQSKGFQSFSVLPYLSKITCPTLVLHGELDEYGSSNFPKSIATAISSHSNYIIMQNCGHIPHREQPLQLLQHIKDFYTEAEGDIYSPSNSLA